MDGKTREGDARRGTWRARGRTQAPRKSDSDFQRRTSTACHPEGKITYTAGREATENLISAAQGLLRRENPNWSPAKASGKRLFQGATRPHGPLSWQLKGGNPPYHSSTEGGRSRSAGADPKGKCAVLAFCPPRERWRLSQSLLPPSPRKE